MIGVAEISESLLQDRTKKNVLHLVDAMETLSVDLDSYLEEIETQKLPVKWYLSWTLTHFIERNPQLELRTQRRLWQMTQACTNPSMARDYWRCWSFLNVHDDLGGEVYEKAVRVVMSSKETLAVRAHAMQCAHRIAAPFPELQAELLSVLDKLDDEAPAIHARSKMISKKLKRQLSRLSNK